MKTPVSLAWIPGLVLTMAFVPNGLAQNAADRPSLPASDAVPATNALAPGFPAITAPKEFPSFPMSEGEASVVKRQPPKIRLSPWTSEIMKLAESGIEDSVILSFIENSGTFNLGADQIVYLNDLGLSSEIITAMLRHDQDIISGVRPLTIASAPDWGAALDSISTADSKGSIKAVPQSAFTPTSSAAPTVEPSSQQSRQALPVVDNPGSMTQPATIQHAWSDELAPVRTDIFSRQERESERKTDLYRIREPYAEEITPPIILIYAEGRPRNTVVVVGFPRTTP